MHPINNISSHANQLKLDSIKETAAEFNAGKTKNKPVFENILGALKYVTSKVSEKVMKAIDNLGNSLSNFFNFSKSFTGATSTDKTDVTRIINYAALNAKRSSSASGVASESLHDGLDIYAQQNVRIDNASNQLVSLRQGLLALGRDIDNLGKPAEIGSDFDNLIAAHVEQPRQRSTPSNATQRGIKSSGITVKQSALKATDNAKALRSRGERLTGLEEKTGNLNSESQNFLQLAKLLAKQIMG